MSKNRPRLELSFRSFKLIAEETEAIQVVRWPLRILLVAAAICAVVVVVRSHPVDWVISAAIWFTNISILGRALS
jgi:hypothetical protein